MLSLSLDGYFKDPDGDISWHHVTEDLHRDVNARLGASGGLLNGRRATGGFEDVVMQLRYDVMR